MSISSRQQLRTVSVLITDENGAQQWVPARPYQKSAALSFFEEAHTLRDILNSYAHKGFSFDRYHFSKYPLRKFYELGQGYFWLEESFDYKDEIILIREDNNSRMRMIIHHTYDVPVIVNGITEIVNL